jgi:hypothetical protein
MYRCTERFNRVSCLQIAQLMEEGRKISEQQLKTSQINKKLQAKAKEQEANAATMTNQIAELAAKCLAYGAQFVFKLHL